MHAYTPAPRPKESPIKYPKPVQTEIVDEDKAKGKPLQGDDDGNNDEEGDEEEQQDDDPAVDPTDGQEGSWTHSCQLLLLVLPYEITPETLSRPES